MYLLSPENFIYKVLMNLRGTLNANEGISFYKTLSNGVPPFTCHMNDSQSDIV